MFRNITESEAVAEKATCRSVGRTRAQKDKKTKIYVWEFPVRFTHWVNVLCILVLSLTGYYISSPFAISAYTKQYLTGWIQFIHFVAAYIFLMSVTIRLYWSLAGNQYAKMTQWLPLTAERLAALLRDIKCHVRMDIKSTCRVGHTSLGGLIFFILHVIFLLQILSGFAMYSVNHTGAYWTVISGWLQDVVPAEQIRTYHHLSMYMVLGFVPVHLSMSFLNNVINRNNIVISILNGNKCIAERDLGQITPGNREESNDFQCTKSDGSCSSE